MQRRFSHGIILSIAILLCITQAAVTSHASPLAPPAMLSEPTEHPYTPTPVENPATTTAGTDTTSMDAFYQQPSATPTPASAILVASTSAQITPGIDRLSVSCQPIPATALNNDSINSTCYNSSSITEQYPDSQPSIANIAGNLISRLLSLFR